MLLKSKNDDVLPNRQKLKETKNNNNNNNICNLVGDVHFELTDCDMIRSMIIWEVSEEAKEKGLPETATFWSSSSAARSSCMTLLGVLERISCGCCGTSAFETSSAETLQDRDRNSIGSRGVSGGRDSTGSGRQGSGMGMGLSMFEVFFNEREFRKSVLYVLLMRVRRIRLSERHRRVKLDRRFYRGAESVKKILDLKKNNGPIIMQVLIVLFFFSRKTYSPFVYMKYVLYGLIKLDIYRI